jgi:hypothetical protein
VPRLNPRRRPPGPPVTDEQKRQITEEWHRAPRAATKLYTHVSSARFHIARRHLLVRKSSIVGLGKEGPKLAARMKLGKTASADPSVFIDWKARLLAMGRAEARRLGLAWATVARTKARLRAGKLPAKGAAVRRLKRALLSGR